MQNTETYLPLTDQQLADFHSIRPLERTRIALDTLTRLANDDSVDHEDVVWARTADVLLDMFLRDAVLLQAISDQSVVKGITALYWRSPPEHKSDLGIVSYLAQLLNGADTSDSDWWHILIDQAAPADPTLHALYQLAQRSTSTRLRNVYRANAQAIAQEVEILEREWAARLKEMLVAPSAPSAPSSSC